MALLHIECLGGLLDACETARSQLSADECPPESVANADAGPVLGSAPVRGPRSSRGVKRSRDELLAAHTLLVPTSPKGKRPSGKRPAGGKAGQPQAGDGRPAPRRARAPRSPDEKRKLSRQMAAFMRLGVLVLPADVKLNKKQKKGDEEGLEYRAAFNLLLDLCFGEHLRAWAHVSNWFYLHAVLLRMATDGAVNLDPEAEAALGDAALLRKASDQQNAQWRLNEARLKQLGVKKEQLAKLFKQVTDGRPIQIPPPPKEANWAPASRARGVKLEGGGAGLSAAPPAKVLKTHAAGGKSGRPAPTGFAPASLAQPLPAAPLPHGPRTGARSVLSGGARRGSAAAASAGTSQLLAPFGGGSHARGGSLLSGGTLPLSFSLGLGDPSSLGGGGAAHDTLTAGGTATGPLPASAVTLPPWPRPAAAVLPPHGGAVPAAPSRGLSSLFRTSASQEPLAEFIAKGGLSTGEVTDFLMRSAAAEGGKGGAGALHAGATAVHVGRGGSAGSDEEVNSSKGAAAAAAAAAQAGGARRLALLHTAAELAGEAAVALAAALAEGALCDAAHASAGHDALLALQRQLQAELVAAVHAAALAPAAAPAAQLAHAEPADKAAAEDAAGDACMLEVA